MTVDLIIAAIKEWPCRHSINVVGESSDGDYYHLYCWAKASGYDEFYDQNSTDGNRLEPS